MVSSRAAEDTRLDSEFDYRRGNYPGVPRLHPNDSSVMTYRGHKVLRTLIRCHFSPPSNTGQRYIYTGSADGRAHVSYLTIKTIE
jgi:WD repeat-containing protein 23